MGDYGQRRGSRAVVEWQQIDAELQEVPEEYREQRFYPLKHVVEIFSSDNPEAHWQEASGSAMQHHTAPVPALTLAGQVNSWR